MVYYICICILNLLSVLENRCLHECGGWREWGHQGDGHGAYGGSSVSGTELCVCVTLVVAV